jgi:acylphosphatase
MIAKEIIVSGKVQGVSFRYFTSLKAAELGILGTVQNLSDGSVKIQAIGTTLQMQEFIKWCHEGSPFSKVKRVEATESFNNNFEDFKIIR